MTTFESGFQGEYKGEERRHDMVTTGELDRRLDRLERSVKEGFEGVQEVIRETSMTYVRLDLYLSERDGLKEDIAAIRIAGVADMQTAIKVAADARSVALWAIGLISTSIIGGVVALFTVAH